MADIALRFHKDALVLSAPLDALLARQGVDASVDREFVDLLEPELVLEAQRLEHMMGAQCLVTNTDGITRARLAHLRFEDQSAEIAQAAVDVVRELSPQHAIASIGPTRLPIDPASKSSLAQSRRQYAQAVQDFGEGVDAILLDGMVSLADLECALEGARAATALPIMASVRLDAHGCLQGRQTTWGEVLETMVRLGADVVGFATRAPLQAVLGYVREACAKTDAPLLVQLEVSQEHVDGPRPAGLPVEPSEEHPYPSTDALFDAALELLPAGVQFFRAIGQATPSYTGALVIATSGKDCTR